LKPVGKVSELWRYPVVGLQGESLKRATIRETGISGDRAYQLRDRSGKILGPVPQSSSPNERSLLGFGASIDKGKGLLTVSLGDEATSVDRPDFEKKLGLAVGVPVRIEESTKPETRVKNGRAIHLISDSSIRALKRTYPAGDFDVRRFRPNLVLTLGGGAEDFAEEAWIGRSLKVGSAVLKVEKPNERCVVPTMSQRGVREDKRILETIVEANDRMLGVLCSVAKSGSVAVGDSVLLGEDMPA
jgi:uncharacterized protein YcbX